MATRSKLFDLALAAWRCPQRGVASNKTRRAFTLLLFGAIAYALWRERPWSRVLMLAFWGANVLVGIGIALFPFAQHTGAWASVVAYSVTLVVAWWYHYRKPGVVAYYRLLEEQAKEGVRDWAPVER
jgi:hypothetical protein